MINLVRDRLPIILAAIGLVLLVAAAVTFYNIREEQRIKALGSAATFSQSQVNTLGRILGIETRGSGSGGQSESRRSDDRPYESVVILSTLGILALGVGAIAHYNRKNSGENEEHQ